METRPIYPKMGPKREWKFQRHGILAPVARYLGYKPKYSMEKNMELPSLAKSKNFSMVDTSQESLNMGENSKKGI